MTDDTLTRVRAALARLAEVEREATPGPWVAGYFVCMYAGHNGLPADKCMGCARGRDRGRPPEVVEKKSDGRLVHKHFRSGGHDIVRMDGTEVAGNDYETGGIIVERDAAAIVALRNAAGPLLALAELAAWRRGVELARAAMAAEPLDYEGDELADQRARCHAIALDEADLDARWGPTVDAALAALADAAPGEVQP